MELNLKDAVRAELMFEREKFIEAQDKQERLLSRAFETIKGLGAQDEDWAEAFKAFQDALGKDQDGQPLERVLKAVGAVMGNEKGRAMCKKLSETDFEFAEMLRGYLLTFSDFARFGDDQAIQAVLREVDMQDMAQALKNADERIVNRFFHNMSVRPIRMLLEDMEFMGYVRPEDIQAAQNMMVATARRLEDAGVISIKKIDENDASFYEVPDYKEKPLVEQPKKGLLARLFGKKSKEEL